MTKFDRAKNVPKLLLVCCFVFASALASVAQTVPPLDAVRVAGGFSAPVFITAPPNDTERVFVVEQAGKIRIIDLATRTIKPTAYLDITSKVAFGGEQGLLGLAFAPDYATSGRFYVNYTAPGGAFGQGVTHVALFRVSSDPDIADASSERTLLTFDQPQTNHNGGWIGFSPRVGDEGNLYIATGDGGNANDQGTGHIEPGGNAQNTTTLLGKMLRIHPDSQPGTYSLPADNPFVGDPNAMEEIWAYGLRNPFRNSFDRLAGTFFIADVGQSSREEINAQDAANPGGGENYGWRPREGLIQNPAFPNERARHRTDPAYDYPRTTGQTVIGGYVYRGRKIKDLRGIYVFADYLGPSTGDFTGRIFTLHFDGTVASDFQDITDDLFPTSVGGYDLANPSSLGEDGRGELYIADISSGNIFQIVRGR